MSVQQVFELKDLNKEALRALQTLNSICRMYDGNCRECPCGFYDGSSGSTFLHCYKCSLAVYKPKDLEFLDIKPTRLVKQYTTEPGIKSDTQVIARK